MWDCALRVKYTKKERFDIRAAGSGIAATSSTMTLALNKCAATVSNAESLFNERLAPAGNLN